ncbi:MAG TPA: hypothetical protein VEC06_05600, partial [Paucimonas sp.]|nr:hypothetical protein [Paucimonas sp.]
EQRADWAYHVENANPPVGGATNARFFQNASAPGDLRQETIWSRGIGYLGNFPEHGLLMDARLFHDRLRNLISEKLQLSDFAPTNGNGVHLRGAELQMHYAPADRWKFNLSYAYLRNSDATTPLEQTQYAKHSGALGATRMLRNGWRVSLAAYGSSGDGPDRPFYGREDLIVSKTTWRGNGTRLTASLIVRHLENRSSRYFQGFGRTIESRYDDSMQYYATFKFTY